VSSLRHLLQHSRGKFIHRSISWKGAKDDHTCMWRRENRLVKVVGVEDDDGYVISTSIGEDGCIWLRAQSHIVHQRALYPSLRKEIRILRGICSSNRNVRGRVIMLYLPRHYVFQRIGVTLDILNLLLAQLLDRQHLFRRQLVFMADLPT